MGAVLYGASGYEYNNNSRDASEMLLGRVNGRLEIIIHTERFDLRRRRLAATIGRAT